jgi:hypothetical protein
MISGYWCVGEPSGDVDDWVANAGMLLLLRADDELELCAEPRAEPPDCSGGRCECGVVDALRWCGDGAAAALSPTIRPLPLVCAEPEPLPEPDEAEAEADGEWAKCAEGMDECTESDD